MSAKPVIAARTVCPVGARGLQGHASAAGRVPSRGGGGCGIGRLIVVLLLCCTPLLVAPAQPAALQEGLLIYLPMKDDLRDHSSQKHWVEVVGTVELKDEAAHFAGNGSWLELPHLALDGRAFAVSMLINPEAAHPAYGLVEQKGLAGHGVGNRWLNLMLRKASQPCLGCWSNDAISPIGISSSVWTHLVFQFTGTHQQIWINGRLICERAATPYLGTKGFTRVGRCPRCLGFTEWDFQGLMRELRIYGRALSFTEIVLLHDQAPPAATANNLTANRGTLVSDAAGAGAEAQPGAVPGSVPFLSIERDHLTIKGAAGQVYVLQATTNLAVPWQPLALLTNLNGRVDFTDVEARRFNERFYRIEVRQTALRSALPGASSARLAPTPQRRARYPLCPTKRAWKLRRRLLPRPKMAAWSTTDHLRFVFVGLRRGSRTAYLGKEPVALSSGCEIMNNDTRLPGNFLGEL